MNRLLLLSCLPAVLTLTNSGIGWSQGIPASANSSMQEQQLAAQLPTTLPVHLCWRYLVIVEGSIGNMQKLQFLVDTGAYPSVVNEEIIRSLGLAQRSTMVNPVNLSHQTVQGRFVILPSLAIGPVHVESLFVLSQDLSFFQKAAGCRVDAIVGLDVLRKTNFSINYRSKQMAFGPVKGLTFSAPFDTDTPLVAVRMHLQDRSLRMVIDTGSPKLLLLQSRVPNLSGFQGIGTEEVSNWGGTFLCKVVRISKAHLGNEDIGSLAGLVVEDHKEHGDDFDGILGVRGSSLWKIAFDFEHRRFWWER